MAEEWVGQSLHQYAIFDRDDSLSDMLKGDGKDNINAPDRYERTPVYTAVSNNSLKCLKLLLEHGADPSIAAGERMNRMTPLHQALIDDKADAIQLLLHHGASIDKADSSGLSPLNLARNIGQTEVVRMFQQEIARRKQNCEKAVKELCDACQSENLAKVREILSLPSLSGFEVANTKKPGTIKTPLCFAAEQGNKDILVELLASVPSIGPLPTAPIHYAIEAHKADMLPILLRKSPECCREANEAGLTPLHLAAQHGLPEHVRILVTFPYPEVERQSLEINKCTYLYKHAIDFNAKTHEGKTPLYLACENGHEQVVSYLLGLEVDVCNQAEIDINVMQMRSSYRREESLDTSQQCRICPVEVNSKSDSSLLVAVSSGHYEIVDLLIKAGAQTDMKIMEDGADCSHLLLIACRRNVTGDLLMLDKLLDHGVEDIGNQVLKEAFQNHVEFVPHILKYKASKDTTNAINKKKMKEDFLMDFIATNDVEHLPSTDPNYRKTFPTTPVYVRWQNLGVLSTVKDSWLNFVGNMYNPTLTNINVRIPLFAITRVDVSGNCLTNLPSALLQLPSLCVLTAAKNRISEFPVQDRFFLDCDCLEEMDLQYNELTDLPSYLFTGLPSLRMLYVSNNKISHLPPALWQLKSLRTLDLSNNCLDHLPKPEAGMWLDTDRKDSEVDAEPAQTLQETDPVHVKRENHWSSLEVSDESMKSAEDQGKGLKILKLCKNKFTEFPDVLSCCAPKLDTLDMSKNSITALGDLQACPKYLKALDLSHNKIPDMDSWTSECDPYPDRCYCGQFAGMASATGRQSALSIGSCSHRRHTRLENLESLDLSFNQLKSVAVLRDEGSLISSAATASFQASCSSIHDIDKKEQEFQRRLLYPNLVSLELNCNKISTLPKEVGKLKSLRSLCLKKNENLKELPAELGLLINLSRIEIEMCPLEGHIQDIIKNSSKYPTKDIIGFLHSVLEESEEYNCMNLMVVGECKIGKTSLLEHLGKYGKQTEMTHYVTRAGNQSSGKTAKGEVLSTVGIDISQLSFGDKKKVVFRTWDFAGQREYYATHQYFLSSRSLYLVVWDITTGEPGVSGLNQWLVNIQAQAPGAPVIIVGTHIDRLKAEKKSFPQGWEKSMKEMIQEKYCVPEPDKSGLPQVCKIVNVACESGKKGQNVDVLKKVIYDLVFELHHPARKHEKLLGHKVPKKYIKLQQCIKEIAAERKREEKEPVLKADHYVLSVMNKMEGGGGFRNKEDLHQATRFLHENGVLCHFQDTALRDQYFIDPQWLCDQLAIVVSSEQGQRFARSGIMRTESLKLLYQKSENFSQHIVSLLNRFEVALQFDNENLIIPSLLPSYKDFESSAIREQTYKIPVKRSGMSVATPQGSITSSFGFNTVCERPLRSVSGGEDLCIIKIDSHHNPTFSFCRLYLMTYFPSGFWPRLITRILADESFYSPSMNLLQFPQNLKQRCPELQNKVPMWRCWQTGLELLLFDRVILQIKEVQSVQPGSTLCDYQQVNLKCFFDNCWNDLDVKNSAILEISFPVDYITFSFGENIGQNLTSLDSRDVFLEEKAQAKLLAKVVEHVDSLLQDWYPELGEARFIQSCLGRYLVTRVIPCPLCLTDAVCRQTSDDQNPWVMVGQNMEDPTSHLRIPVECNETPQQTEKEQGTVVHSFLVEKCIMNVFVGQDEICDTHGSVSPKLMVRQDGVSRQLFVAPDLQFSDVEQTMLVEKEELELERSLGRGAFGQVYAGKLKRNNETVQEVAVKILYSDDNNGPVDRGKRSSQLVLEQVCMAYTTARQEVSILQTVQHSHIVPLLGLSKQPLALLLSLAPKGSLSDILRSTHKDGLSLPPFVIRTVVVQVSDALDYLHTRNIIYRDLKSDNVLVWHFPHKLTDTDPRQAVNVKLADYGISRPVLPDGTKGFGGTPPFIAPEILVSTGKDTYTEKVDIFSFGMFMFELVTCRQPLEGVNNPTAHVCHGGRPSLTPEEITCPSHMLDLMAICWAQEPENRPTAAQVRMIASCPQFCHLSDAVSMETKSASLSSCSVFVEGDTAEDSVISEDHSQVWLSSVCGSAYNIEVYSYNLHHRCISCKTLPTKTSIMGMCVVLDNIWCLDAEGELHIYSYTSANHTSFSLKVNKVLLVNSMFYHGDQRVVVLLIQESSQKGSSLFIIPDTAKESKHVTDSGVYLMKMCNCAAMVKSEEGYSIWLGISEGQILVKALSRSVENTTLKTRDPPHSDVDCWFITTASDMDWTVNSAWTYNYPGSTVYRWDADEKKVVAELDCSCMVPITDTYHVTTRRAQLSAKHYQITAMTVVDRYLYIGTTWGCVTVADAVSLKPYSVFRCHSDQEFYVRSILPLGPRQLRERKGSDSNLTVNYQQERGVLTVGRGYVDIISHVTRLERQALIREEMDDGFQKVTVESTKVVSPSGRGPKSNNYLLSWIGNQWEYF